MITKFLRKRNQKTGNAFDKQFARIQVHANGDQTFKFKKTVVASTGSAMLNTETGFRLTTELSQHLLTN
jgi:hypothetical protein